MFVDRIDKEEEVVRYADGQQGRHLKFSGTSFQGLLIGCTVDLETGYEGYFIVDSRPVDAKRRAVTIEETHPLGRLFDLDVIIHASLDLPYFEDGVRPIGRQELGLPQRKCLICGKPVRECMRTRSHTPEELITRIESIVEKSHIIMYKYKQSGNTYILSLDNHVEVTAALAAFCEERGIQSGSIEGLGAVSEATFRYLNPETMKYVDKTFREQMEITALVGNISRKDGKPYLHIHITASRSDYSCIGGHLLTARINGACELFVKDLGVEVGRCLDEETGINLYSL